MIKNLNLSKIYANFEVLSRHIISISPYRCFDHSTIKLYNQYCNLPYNFKDKLKDRYLVIAILSKFNQEVNIFIDRINNPCNYIEDFVKASENVFKEYQSKTGGPKWFWGYSGIVDNKFNIFFDKNFYIPYYKKSISQDIEDFQKPLYPVAVFDNDAFKDYVYRIK